MSRLADTALLVLLAFGFATCGAIIAGGVRNELHAHASVYAMSHVVSILPLEVR